MLFSYRKFESNQWNNRIDLRKYYVRDVLYSSEFMGKTKNQIEQYFGLSESTDDIFNDCCVYFVRNKGNKKYYLVFYFDADHVIDIKYEYQMII